MESIVFINNKNIKLKFTHKLILTFFINNKNLKINTLKTPFINTFDQQLNSNNNKQQEEGIKKYVMNMIEEHIKFSIPSTNVK